MHYSFILGIISLVAGIYLVFTYLKTKNSGDPIKATVIGYSQGNDNRGKTIYNPIVKFELNGESYEMPTDLSDSKELYEIGSEIDVYFIKGKDYVMRAGGKNNSLKEGFIFVAIGAVLIILNLLRK